MLYGFGFEIVFLLFDMGQLSTSRIGSLSSECVPTIDSNDKSHNQFVQLSDKNTILTC